jgi:hypothetical protein
MDLKSRLIVGMKKEDVNLLVKEVLASESLYAEMVSYAMSNNRTQAMKAAWVLGHASGYDKATPSRYIREWKLALETTRVGGVQRELVKIMGNCTLPEEIAGWFLDKCFSLLQSPASEPASKYHSLTYLIRQTKIYPELKEELANVLESQLNWHTPAWQRYAAKHITKLRKKQIKN